MKYIQHKNRRFLNCQEETSCDEILRRDGYPAQRYLYTMIVPGGLAARIPTRWEIPHRLSHSDPLSPIGGAKSLALLDLILTEQLQDHYYISEAFITSGASIDNRELRILSNGLRYSTNYFVPPQHSKKKKTNIN